MPLQRVHGMCVHIDDCVSVSTCLSCVCCVPRVCLSAFLVCLAVFHAFSGSVCSDSEAALPLWVMMFCFVQCTLTLTCASQHPGDPLLDFPSDDVELQVIPTRPVPIGTTLTPVRISFIFLPHMCGGCVQLTPPCA